MELTFWKFSLLILQITLVCAQDEIMWMWKSGDSHRNQALSKNNPGSRSGSAIWKENNTLIWLFGGEMYNKDTNSHQLTNDLWTYNVRSGEWHQIHPGTNVHRRSTDISLNVPPARHLSATCGATGEVMLIFGGIGEKGALDDTWLYHIRERKWKSFSEINKQTDEKSKISPSARGDTTEWCQHDQLVIFGGENHNQELFNDVWKFSLINLQWSKAKSSKQLPDNEIGMSLIRYPKARSGATTWISGSELYMFGGKVKSNIERSKNFKVGYSSDLWMYNAYTDRWSFVSGYEDPGHAAVYGKLGRSDKGNIPGGRKNGAGFIDNRGNFWLFGGEGTDDTGSSYSKHLSDLWRYNKMEKKWAWMGGAKIGNQGGKFKNQHENVVDGYPGGRSESVSWKVDNTFYIYGGTGHDVDNKDGILNDLWMIDVHNKVEYENSAYAGTVFMIVFTFLGLTCLVAVSFMYTKKFFRQTVGDTKHPYDVEYHPLTDRT